VEALTDDRHTKLDTLRELLTEVHSDEKVLVFSAFNDALMPILEKHFSEWGVTYVRYHGSDTQKQAAQDAFADDNNVQVFLSSDAGSDSLSLEQASVVIHYDLPWKWSTFIQRQNRIHRVVSKFEKVRYYTLQMADSVEDRKVEIIQRKSGYHQSIFQGEDLSG
jgi:SNF2 family DNA or RNA helicase